MSVEKNKEVVKQYYERGSKGDTSVIDEFTTKDFVLHTMGAGRNMDREALKQFVSNRRISFPDLSETIEDMIAEGDKVSVRVTVRGTQTEQYHTIAPTGESTTTTRFTIYRLEGGKIAESWTLHDRFGMYQQLGVIKRKR